MLYTHLLRVHGVGVPPPELGRDVLLRLVVVPELVRVVLAILPDLAPLAYALPEALAVVQAVALAHLADQAIASPVDGLREREESALKCGQPIARTIHITYRPVGRSRSRPYFGVNGRVSRVIPADVLRFLKL